MFGVRNSITAESAHLFLLVDCTRDENFAVQKSNYLKEIKCLLLDDAFFRNWMQKMLLSNLITAMMNVFLA